MTKTDTQKTPLSFDTLNVRDAGSKPFEFEVRDDEGKPQGWFISVYSDQSDIVRRGLNDLMRERRILEQTIEMKVGAEPKDRIIDPSADIEFGQKAAAIRIAGWRGLDREYTPELGTLLCEVNAGVVRQVIYNAGKSTNFTQR